MTHTSVGERIGGGLEYRTYFGIGWAVTPVTGPSDPKNVEVHKSNPKNPTGWLGGDNCGCIDCLIKRWRAEWQEQKKLIASRASLNDTSSKGRAISDPGTRRRTPTSR